MEKKEVQKSGVAIPTSDKRLVDEIVKVSGIRSFFLIGNAIREWAQVHGYQYIIDMVQSQGGSDATSM